MDIIEKLLAIVNGVDEKIEEGEKPQGEQGIVVGDLVKTHKAMGYEEIRTALLRYQKSKKAKE